MTNNFDAGSISWDDHDALLFVRVGVIRVTLPQNKVDFCSRVTCAADVPGTWKGMRDVTKLPTQKGKKKPNEPFMSIDDYFIPFPPDRGANVCGVGGCDLSPWRGQISNQALWSVIRNAPNLSVIANAERISPFNRGISHFFCCSALP
jgi:hypothetical protein